jgi:hypothetical protein
MGLSLGGTDLPAGWGAPELTAQLNSSFAVILQMLGMAGLALAGFVAPWLAGVAPHTLDIPGGTFQLAMTSVWVAFAIVMVVTATALWRAGHSRTGAVLAVIGAVATPGVGPIGSAVLAIGLGLVALGQLRTRGQHLVPTSLEHTVA